MRSREMHGKCGVATFAERGEEGAFDGCGERCFFIAGARKKIGICGARLQRDGGLRCCRNHFA